MQVFTLHATFIFSELTIHVLLLRIHYSLQNSINDFKIAAVAGASRTLGVIVTVSAGVYNPGVVLRTDLNPHCFKVGELDGQDTPRARELASMLAQAIQGPAKVTTNLLGQRWSKLIVNCMNNALAGLTGWKTAKARMHADTQRIGIQLAAEVVLVARAHGIHVDGVMGLSPDTVVGAAKGHSEQLRKCQEQLSEMARVAGSLSRPSFGQDVVKGRRTEIDELNGLVARKGREKGIETPFCDKIVQLIHALGVGFKPDPKHIRPLIAMLPPHTTPTATPALASATTSAPASGLQVAVLGAGYFAQVSWRDLVSLSKTLLIVTVTNTVLPLIIPFHIAPRHAQPYPSCS